MKNRHFIYIIVFVVALGFLLLWYAGRPKQEQVVMVKPPEQSGSAGEEVVQRDVTLYFASETGEHLVSESRQIGCSGEEDCVQAVVEALISGPV
nr:GerMN domain-containing protein [Desulfuromonadales bacterium]NIS43847.1 GerMN domain-containing protein [Desulfuromonadales bacterium]